MLIYSNWKSVVTGLSLAAAMTVAATSAMAVTAGVIPDNPGTNDGVNPIYGTATRAGWYGATLYLNGGPAQVTATLLGYEAGFTNSFAFNASSLVGGGGNSWVPGGSIVANGVLSGLLNFSFLTSGFGGLSVANGSNPDAFGGANVGPNFFVSFGPLGTETSGIIADLWFDDGGAGPDDNHDDLLIRLVVKGGTLSLTPLDPAPGETPIPGAAFLMGTVLAGGAGFGAWRRRRRNA